MINRENKEPKEKNSENNKRYIYKFLPSAFFNMPGKTDKKVPLAPYPKKAILIIMKAR